MEQWEYTAKVCDMLFGALEKREGIMIDPVERDLKEYLRDREEEYQRRCACEGRWDSMRENIKRELLEALELLSPFHTNTNGEKLDAFLDRLADIHDEVEGLKGEWK